jgi:hypothetical protein
LFFEQKQDTKEGTRNKTGNSLRQLYFYPVTATGNSDSSLIPKVMAVKQKSVVSPPTNQE